MIPRYTPAPIGEVWKDETKFQTWLEVEIAVIQARCNLGEYDADVISQIRPAARFSIEAIERLERQIEHDLLAFVEVVRQSLPPEFRRFFHDGLTSYDTEVPALALQFRQAGKILLCDLDKLINVLRLKASENMWTYCMGITHGQDAKPTTFGWRLCGYLELMEQAKVRITETLDSINDVKCSGAVGNYMTLSPELEEEVCRVLGLRVRRAATQIVARDVFAQLLSTIATTGGSIEKIATDLRILALSGINEVREPRREKQKGSSAMPHKKNPILLERMCGLAIVLRGYATMGQELIRTWLERDIAHSSVERIAFPDATILLDYMFQRMTWILSGLEVDREQMAFNIGRSIGCWASEEVKLLLCEKGFDPEVVYTFVQTCAFAAFERKQQFLEVLLKTVFPLTNKPLQETVDPRELNTCFDFRRAGLNLKKAYTRMELDETKALPPNIE